MWLFLCCCRAARHAASVRAKVSQAQSAAKLRARQESDLQLQVTEVARRRRDFEKLYDLVRQLLALTVKDKAS
jgi:hypothetical protein